MAGDTPTDAERGSEVATDYVARNAQVKALVSRLEIHDPSAKPWRDGVLITSVFVSSALNAYTVQIYIKPTGDEYADNPYEWAFLGASLFYNWSLMTYFGSDAIEQPLRFICDLSKKETRAEACDELKRVENWVREPLEVVLAGVASIMMADVGKQDGFTKEWQQVMIASAFALVSKAGGAKELVNDALLPLLRKVADRAILLQCDSPWRRSYVLWHEREKFVDALAERANAAQAWLRSHRGEFTEVHRALAAVLTDSDRPASEKQLALFKALFTLPVEEEAASKVCEVGKTVAGGLVTVTALTITLASQVGLYRNAAKYGGLIGSITIAVNGFMSLLMAKGLGSLVSSLGSTPQPLAHLARAIGFAIFSIIDFGGGLLTAGTTADEIKKYYEGRLSDALLGFMNFCAYAGSSFFNGYGLVGAVAGLFVAYHLYKEADVETNDDHLEAVLSANLERLAGMLTDSDKSVLLKGLQQLHNDGHINLNDERLRSLFEKLELKPELEGSEKVRRLAVGGQAFQRGLVEDHCYRITLRWQLFIGHDLLLCGGIVAARVASGHWLPEHDGIVGALEDYALGGALAGLVCIGSDLCKAAGQSSRASDDVLGDSDYDEPLVAPGVNGGATEGGQTASASSGYSVCQFFKGAATAATSAAVGAATQLGVNWILTTFFSNGGDDSVLPEVAGVTSAAVTASYMAQM